MLRVKCRGLFCSGRSPFFSPTTISDNVDEHQVTVLIDELSRERFLVKSLRNENDTLRNSLMTLNQRESELDDLNNTLMDKEGLIQSYKMKNAENELRLNELHLKFRDYKEAVEIEKKKLEQIQALPIILAGVCSGLFVYLSIKSYISIEKQQFKYLKFELENMWLNRIRDIDARLVKSEDECNTLALENASLKKSNQNRDILSIYGRKIL